MISMKYTKSLLLLKKVNYNYSQAKFLKSNLSRDKTGSKAQHNLFRKRLKSFQDSSLEKRQKTRAIFCNFNEVE